MRAENISNAAKSITTSAVNKNSGQLRQDLQKLEGLDKELRSLPHNHHQTRVAVSDLATARRTVDAFMALNGKRPGELKQYRSVVSTGHTASSCLLTLGLAAMATAAGCFLVTRTSTARP